MADQTDRDKLARIAANLKRQNDLEQQRIQERIERANQEVQRLVDRFLQIDPDIQTIVLFGSLAEGTAYSIHFDIDLAVRSRKYLELVGCGLRSPFRVDVVDLDRVAKPIKDSIERYGKVLYYDDGRKTCFSTKISTPSEDIAIFSSVAIEDCDMRRKKLICCGSWRSSIQTYSRSKSTRPWRHSGKPTWSS
jgi:predicted nucleotidyltransferase